MRRVLLGAVVTGVLLSGASGARADVFLPADPAPSDALCTAAARDVVAGVREEGDRPLLDVTEAGGTAHFRLPVSPNPICPRVTAAADGTAVIATSGLVLVRRPGGRFGAPVAAGRSVVPDDVAAAPGGWVAVVGQRRRLGRVATSEVVATIFAPDGTHRSAVLEHRRDDFFSPRIGIDAHGNATTAWTRWNVISARYAVRAAHAATGGTWAPASTLANGDEPLGDFVDVGQIDVAVAPGGHTLLAWADGRGVQAAVDGGPAQRLTTERGAGAPTAEIGDDGSAVVAYLTDAPRILAVDRGPATAWSAPHVLHGSDGPVEDRLAAVLAPDGRAAVAWIGLDEAATRVFAASGRPGGAWTAAAPVSAITRSAEQASLALGVAGDPRLAWTESGPRGGAARVRGARLAPDAEAVAGDHVAPAIETHLPRRSPRTRSGAVAFLIPVRCSEACDARVRLIDRRRGIEQAAVVRAVPAGRQVTVRLSTAGYFAHQLLMSRRARRPRIEVLATDRAGNVARVSRTVRVRIVPRPLISFRVAPDHEFEMFTRAGDRAVARLVNELITALAAKEIDSVRDLRRRYQRGVRAIARTHDEIYDTAVQEEIFIALEVPLARAGYDANSVMSY